MSHILRPAIAAALTVVAALLVSFWLPHAVAPEHDAVEVCDEICVVTPEVPAEQGAELEATVACLELDPENAECLADLFLLHMGDA